MAWDFRHILSIDIIEYFQFPNNRSWDEFWDFFRFLPIHSKTKAKISMDEEVAIHQANSMSEEEIQEIIDARAEEGYGELDFEDYTLQISKMNEMIDEIKLLRMSILASFGSKDKNFKPTPRPKSELDRQIDKRIAEVEKKNNQELMAEFGF